MLGDYAEIVEIGPDFRVRIKFDGTDKFDLEVVMMPDWAKQDPGKYAASSLMDFLLILRRNNITSNTKELRASIKAWYDLYRESSGGKPNSNRLRTLTRNHVCVKCGYTEVFKNWVPAMADRPNGYYQGPCKNGSCVDSRETIHVSCGDCGACWLELPLDAPPDLPT